MAIKATIDGQEYNDIQSIVTGGKVIDLIAPDGTMNVKSGKCKFSSAFKIAHGCGKRPKYVFVYLDDYSTVSPQINKTSLAFYIEGVGSSCVVSSTTLLWNSCYMQLMGAEADDTNEESTLHGLFVDEEYIRFDPALVGYDLDATWYAIYEV